jgi:histone deacetylase 6
MRFHRDAQQHPEQPQRINVIWELLEKAGLIEDPLDEPNPDNSDRLFNLGFRPADPAEITLVHTLEHFEWVRGLRGML